MKKFLIRLGAAAGLLPGLLGAQVPDTVPAVPLDTLTVTALRTPFVAVRAPYSVTVVDAEQIQRAKPGLGLDEALRVVPGVQVDNRFNYALGERISIRGFGARAQFGVRGIKVLLDGIPLTLPDGQTTLNQVDLGALGRAEVLRGPASALYGNAAGGVILLESDVPEGVEARVVGGENGLRRVQGAIGGRGESLLYGVTASHLRYGGYRAYSDAESSWLTARVRTGALQFVASGVRYDARNPGSLSDSLLRVDRRQAFANNIRQQTGETGHQGQVGATWNQLLGPGELGVTAYALTREIENPIPQRIIDLERVAGGTRLAYAVAVPNLRWTVGGEADAQRDERENFLNRAGVRGDAAVLDQRERVTNVAGFTQLAATLGTRVDLLASLRYDWFRFGVDDRLITAANPDDSGIRTLDALSPALGASVRVSDALNVYGNIATAFETPTTTELANQPTGAGGFNPDLEPQRTRSYEVGAKGWLGRVAAYQIAAYRARIEDALIPFRVPNQPDRDFFRNAGSAIYRGWEAGVSVAPIRGVRGLLAYTYTDARFEDYTVGDDVYDDNRVPGIAPRQLNALVTFDLPRTGYLELETRYASDTPVNDANSATSPSYWLTAARLGSNRVRLGRVVVAPFVGVSNLFDVEYNTSVVINGFGGRFYEPGPGRALYAGVEARFGGGE